MEQNENPQDEPSEVPEEASQIEPPPAVPAEESYTEPPPDAETEEPYTEPPAPTEAIEEIQEPEPEETPAAPDEEEKKQPSFIARAFRWLLIVLIFFGIGAILTLFLLYVPARDDLKGAQQRIEKISSQSEADLQEARDEIKRLSALEKQNDALTEERDQTVLEITMLKIRTDVLTAQVALFNGDNEKALLAVSKTPETLDNLGSLLPAEHSDFVESLQKRLELARDGIENEDSAAESDLNVLIIKLLELEDALLR